MDVQEDDGNILSPKVKRRFNLTMDVGIIKSVSGRGRIINLCLVSAPLISDSPTFSVGHHHTGLPVVRRDGTAGPAVAPLAPPALVVSSLVHLSRAPGLKTRKL